MLLLSCLQLYICCLIHGQLLGNTLLRVIRIKFIFRIRFLAHHSHDCNQNNNKDNSNSHISVVFPQIHVRLSISVYDPIPISHHHLPTDFSLNCITRLRRYPDIKHTNLPVFYIVDDVKGSHERIT